MKIVIETDEWYPVYCPEPLDAHCPEPLDALGQLSKPTFEISEEEWKEMERITEEFETLQERLSDWLLERELGKPAESR